MNVLILAVLAPALVAQAPDTTAPRFTDAGTIPMARSWALQVRVSY